MIVIDASAFVDLVGGPRSTDEWLTDRVDRARTIHVPAVFDLEVLHSFRGLEAAGKLSGGDLAAALADYVDLRATRYGHEPLRSRVWELRHNLTAYDAAYVALAEALEAPLVTTDVRLAGSSGHEATIESPPV
jgi:predicted nucleic acid-binding protein